MESINRREFLMGSALAVAATASTLPLKNSRRFISLLITSPYLSPFQPFNLSTFPKGMHLEGLEPPRFRSGT